MSSWHSANTQVQVYNFTFNNVLFAARYYGIKMNVGIIVIKEDE
jgi:hypothetical protein